MSSAPSHAHVAAASSGLLLQSDPLHRACKAGRWAEVRALISECGRTRQARSFYVNRRDANGSSPIFHCVWYGFYRVLALLLYHGANPNLQNNRRNTALHLVCEQMHWGCAGLLLQAGARIDFVNGEGKTCLQTIPTTAERHDAAEFAAYIVAQHHVYARESACRADLFEMVLPPPPPLPATQQPQSAATRAAMPPENEAIRRLCWSIHHLEKDSPAWSQAGAAVAAASSHAATARPANAHSAASASGNGGGGSGAAPSIDDASAQLDPDLLAPIHAVLWSAANSGAGLAGWPASSSGMHTPAAQQQQQQSSPAPGVSSPSSNGAHAASVAHTHLRPHHRPTASTSSAMSGISAASAGMPVAAPAAPAMPLSPESKSQLISALHSLHQLALRFPPSQLGPGLEERHQPSLSEGTGTPGGPAPGSGSGSEQHGPELSGPGLAHFAHYLATHWPGLPLSYKKFFLGYLTRFSSDVSNAAALAGSTRGLARNWIPSPERGPAQSVLERLVDAVLDWLELQRGLSSAEPECSLLPPSKTFCSVAAALGSAFPPQANALTCPPNAGTVVSGGSAGAAAGAGAGGANSTSRASMAATPRRSAGSGSGGSALASPADSFSPTPSFGAAFAGLVAPVAGGGPQSPRTSPFSPTRQSAQSQQSNPFVPEFSYVDDYEVASLLLELVASVLYTLRTQSHLLSGQMLESACGSDAGEGDPAGPTEAQRQREMVSAEERAPCVPGSGPGSGTASLLPKEYSPGGGGGTGMLPAVSHPFLELFGQPEKEGVADRELDARLQAAEEEARMRVAKRLVAVAAAAAAKKHSSQFDAGRAGGNSTATPCPPDRALVSLWRNVVRLFEQGPSSPLMRLGALILRAPFPPVVHPLLSVRALFLWGEGFSCTARWCPRVCDAFRSPELVKHTLVCLRSAEHLLRPHGQRGGGAGAARGDRDQWKRALVEALGADTADQTIQMTSPRAQPRRRTLGAAAHATAASTPGLDAGTSPLGMLRAIEIAAASNPLPALHLPLPVPVPSSLSLSLPDEAGPGAAAAASGGGTAAGHSGSMSTLPAPLPNGQGTHIQQGQAQQGAETTRELHTLLGMRGAELTAQAGAQALLRKLHEQDLSRPLPPPPGSPGPASGAGTGFGSTSTKTKPLFMPHLRTEDAEPDAPAFPLSSRRSLRTSPSQTALELASPIIQGAAQSLLAYNTAASTASSAHHQSPSHRLNSRAVSSRLRSATQSQAGRHKLSTKEAVMRELAQERLEAERAEALRLQQEEITVLRIGDPTKIAAHAGELGAGNGWAVGAGVAAAAGGGAASALSSPFGSRRGTMSLGGLAPLSLPTNGVGPAYSALGSPSSPGAAAPPGTVVPLPPQNSSALPTSALPDFYSGGTVAARLMLVDRGAEYVLALVLDSARRAQLLAARKAAAVAAVAAAGAGAGLKNRGAAPVSNSNPSYGPPPLTSFCASLMNQGVVDYMLLLLSPQNQSLACHRGSHAALAASASASGGAGARVVWEEDEGRGVHQALQVLSMLLRMSSATELIFRSGHALALYGLLQSTGEVHLASSALFILAHLVRKREWNKRILALRGADPDEAFGTGVEAPATAPATTAAPAAAATTCASAGDSAAADDNRTPHVPFEFLLIKWARIAVHLALTTLPLKPWSTLPRTLLLGRLPSTPAETPVRALVYPARALGDPVVAAGVDRQRALDREKDRVAGAAKLARRLEAQRLDQEEADRTFLTALGAGGDDRRDNPPASAPSASEDGGAGTSGEAGPDSTALVVVLTPPSSSSASSGEAVALDATSHAVQHGPERAFEADHALSSSAIPPPQSWFARHYTPPSAEQKQYARQLQRAQERKMVAAAATAATESVSPTHAASTLTSPQTPPPPPMPRPEFAEKALLSGSGLFVPISAFSGTPESESYATALYARSSAARFGIGTGTGIGGDWPEGKEGGVAASSSAVVLPARPDEEMEALDRDVNTLLLEQMISGGEGAGARAPADKARTLRMLGLTTAAAPPGDSAAPSPSSRHAAATTGSAVHPNHSASARNNSSSTGDGPCNGESGGAVIGGTTPHPSHANIAMSESLFHRVLQCFTGFLREEAHAARVLHCGALELLAGLVTHPVYDLSLLALRLLVALTSRFGEAFLVAVVDGLLRKHLVHSWMGVGREYSNSDSTAMAGGGVGGGDGGRPRALVRAHKNDTGFPWPTLDSLVSAAAEFLRVDVSYTTGAGAGSNNSGGGGGGDGPSDPSSPASPLRDERSALSFQLLLNLCQDPLGRGYAAVSSQAVWFENLLPDVLAHPALADLEERQRRFRRDGGAVDLQAARERFPFGADAGHDHRDAATAAAAGPAAPAASRMSHGGSSSSNLHLQSPVSSHRGSHTPPVLSRSPSSQSRLRHLTTPSPARTSTRGSFSSSPRDGLLRPASASTSASSMQRRGSNGGAGAGVASVGASPHSPSRPLSSSGSPSIRSSASASPPELASALAPSVRFLAASGASSTDIVPVAPFGGHWSAQGGVPLERHYAGGTGFPLHAGAPGSGLDWELPSASSGGSTELLSLLADAQLATQPVALRVCGLASCSAVEHAQGSFVLCPRCQQVSYCCAAHRRLAWRSWHERVCSVTKRKVQGENQTIRYPVRQVERRMHSTLPAAVRHELLGSRARDQT